MAVNVLRAGSSVWPKSKSMVRLAILADETDHWSCNCHKHCTENANSCSVLAEGRCGGQ